MKPEIVDGFVVVGDLAYLPDEWERIERRRAKDRIRKNHRYRSDPEYRARYLAYHREWKRQYRAAKRPVASLHPLRCTGPTRATGCRCTHKIRLYARMEEAA